MLTAKTAESRIEWNGLDLGADDYVTKPFSLRELSAGPGGPAPQRRSRKRRPAMAYNGDLN